MTKSEQSAVSRARQHAKAAPGLAAAALATLHRSARTQRTQREDVRRIFGVAVQTKPAAPCPKPTTNESFGQLIRAGAYYKPGVV